MQCNRPLGLSHLGAQKALRVIRMGNSLRSSLLFQLVIQIHRSLPRADQRSHTCSMRSISHAFSQLLGCNNGTGKIREIPVCIGQLRLKPHAKHDKMEERYWQLGSFIYYAHKDAPAAAFDRVRMTFDVGSTPLAVSGQGSGLFPAAMHCGHRPRLSGSLCAGVSVGG